MKKIVTAMLSVGLVAALSAGAFAAVTYKAPNNDIQKRLELTSDVDMGDSFLKSQDKPQESADAEAAKAFDDDDSTVWEVTDGSTAQLTFDKLTTVNNVNLKEKGNQIRKFHIDAWNGQEWVKVYNNDLIEGYHLAVFDTIKTYALRLVVDEVANGATSGIRSMSAIHQRPIVLDNEFVDAAYVASKSYQSDDFPLQKEMIDSMTDLILMGNFNFTSEGKFVIWSEDGHHASDAPETDATMKESLDRMNGFADGKLPRLWMCINAGGLIEPEDSGIFTEESAAAFAKDVTAFAKKYGFVGVDLDWEALSSHQWPEYETMIKALGPALHKEGLLLSSAQAMDSPLSAEAFSHLDRLNLMAYDRGATANSQSSFADCADYAIKHFVNDLMVPREKLILGLPWYSNTFDGNGSVTQWSSAGWSQIAPYLQEEDEEGNLIMDYGVNYHKGKSFNGPNLIRDKVVYAAKNRIGGVFCWVAHTDVDYSKPYSLARVTRETIDEYVIVK